MLTICETPYFSKICFMYWDEKEYEEFKTFLSLNPNVGDVEPNSGGIRRLDGQVVDEVKALVFESFTLTV